MKMVGRTAHQCDYGCCRAYPPSKKNAERRVIKRSERNKWKTETKENQ